MTVYAKVTRPSVFAGKIWVGLEKKIQAQDRLSGEKFKFLYTSKHSSLVKLGAVWLNVKTYQTDCPVKNKNFRIDCYDEWHIHMQTRVQQFNDWIRIWNTVYMYMIPLGPGYHNEYPSLILQMYT